LSVFDSNLNLPRHRWYSLKEGFSEELVRIAVDDVAKGRGCVRILDPFVGSGTSVVAAGRIDSWATGIEVNPFLRYAAAAKCAPPLVTRGPARRLVERLMLAFDHERRSELEGLLDLHREAGRGQVAF
jgi:hypothetical protein